MKSYLIEVPHEEDEAACFRAIEVFIKSGSHFLANAEWGCRDNEHKAWMIVELENRDQAMMLVPSMYRDRAKVTELFRVTREDVKEYQETRRMKQSKEHHL